MRLSFKVILLIFLTLYMFQHISTGSGRKKNNGPQRKDGESDRRYSSNRCSGKSNSDGSCDMRDKRNRDL